jgi:hypothetical protein
MTGDPAPHAPYLPHPLTGIVPRMSDATFLALRESVRACGLLPGGEVVLYEGQVLDGRHLYEACLAEGVPPRFREYTGDDPQGYVVAQFTRRDLGPSGKAMLVAGVLRRQAERGGSRWTHAQLALRFGVGRSTVLEATRVLMHGVPALRRMVENGEVTVKHAERVCRLPAREQQRVVDAGPSSVKLKGWQLKKDKVRLPVPPEPPASRMGLTDGEPDQF